MSNRRTKTFSEGLARRFDKAKEYPKEPDNRTLERILLVWDCAGDLKEYLKKRSEKK